MLTEADIQLHADRIRDDGYTVIERAADPDLVESSGLRVLSATDLTDEWGPILRERLAMYQRLREEARQAGTPMGHDAFHKSYVRFVELIQHRKLGGVRIVAVK